MRGKEINPKFEKYIAEVILYKDEILRIIYRKRPSNEIVFQDVLNYENLASLQNTFDSENIIGQGTLKEIHYDIAYIKITNSWAENSYATRKKVGALFVKKQMIISDGFNGTPKSFPNACEDENNVSYPYVMHAEQNALSKLACSTQSSKGSTLYVSMSPCADCAKQVIQAKTKKVVFWEFYRLDEGVEWMLKSGIDIYYYNSAILNDIKRS